MDCFFRRCDDLTHKVRKTKKEEAILSLSLSLSLSLYISISLSLSRSQYCKHITIFECDYLNLGDGCEVFPAACGPNATCSRMMAFKCVPRCETNQVAKKKKKKFKEKEEQEKNKRMKTVTKRHTYTTQHTQHTVHTVDSTQHTHSTAHSTQKP